MAIILDKKSSVKKFIFFKKTLINSDRLLNAMSDYIMTGSLSWNTDLPINCEYEEIDYVINNNEKEKNLEKYMDNWYNNHSEYAWYGSHLKSNNTYCGYWSFECAAICKMLGIKDTKLKKSNIFLLFRLCEENSGNSGYLKKDMFRDLKHLFGTYLFLDSPYNFLISCVVPS